MPRSYTPPTLPPIRTWNQDGFRLRITRARQDARGRAVLSYVLHDYDWDGGEGRHLFVGDDYRPSPMHLIDSDDSVAALLSFLALGEGDTDDAFFVGYSDLQRDWRDSDRRELLASIAGDMEERLLATEQFRPNTTARLLHGSWSDMSGAEDLPF